MTERNLLDQRLNNQQLVSPLFSSAGDVVHWLGAVQAQDFFGSLWSIGMRTKKAITEETVEHAIAERAIVRTWPMRGTLHFVSSKDIYPILTYLPPKVYTRFESILLKDGLDPKTRSKAKKIWEKELRDDKNLTRDEMYAALERAKIATEGTRGLHLLAVAAQDAVICFGPRKGKQQTFTLLEEWITKPTSLTTREETLADLAKRYIRSHGPVMIEDFAWWTGLNKGEATKAFQSIEKDMEVAVTNEKKFWLDPSLQFVKPKTNKAYLLPTYDEFGIAYKNREEFILADDHKMVGGRFTSSLMINGKMIGTWRRTLEKKQVLIEVQAFKKFSPRQLRSITTEAKAFGKFLKLPAKVVTP